MTQPDDLQQAYDRAMAHNVMLSEALWAANWEGINEEDYAKIKLAIDATDSTIQAWVEKKMAHNAMLREALGNFEVDCITRLYDGGWNIDLINVQVWMREREDALCATKADVTAWEKKLRQEVMLAVHPLQPEYEKLKQQLATVTAERDALQDQIKQYKRLFEEGQDKVNKAKANEAAVLRRYQNLFSRVNTLAQKADT